MEFIGTFGPPDVVVTDGSGNSFDLPNVSGIVLMDFPSSSLAGHIAGWNEARTVENAVIKAIAFCSSLCRVSFPRAGEKPDEMPPASSTSSMP